jgi:site-specific recombinase XerD
MTPKALLSEKYSFSSVNNPSYDNTPFEDYSNFINLDTYLGAISKSELLIENFVEEERSELVHRSRRRGLEKVLNKLSLLQIPGKEEVGEYLRDQYRRYCRPNTLRQSLITMDNFLAFIGKAGKVQLEEIIREDLGAWIEHEQDRGLKASTVNMRLRTLKGFIRFLIEKGIVRSEVLSKRMSVKVPKSLPRAMDPEDVKNLLRVLKDTRDRAMVLVLLRTGMRIGELLSTLVSEVNLKQRRIEIYEAEKTRVGRVVYLSDDAIAALKAWVRKRERKNDYLFYGRGGNPLTYTAARKRFEICLETAGLSHKGYSLHCLRHTFATELLNAGMRLECLRRLLGHNSIEMTRRYARLTDKSREEEYFRAMAIIERGELDGYHQLDRELQATPKEKELLSSYGEQLHEHP